MKEHIVKYCLSEVYGASVNIAAGIVFIIIAVILWRMGAVHSLSRGLAYTLLCGGLFFSAVCVGVVIHNKQMIKKTEQRVVADIKELQSTEVARMEKVMTSGFAGGMIQFSLFVLTGLILALAARNNMLLKGIGLGLLILGTFGHVAEAFSMQRNKAYLNEVKELRL